jgi:hypothetical protein
MAGLHGHGTQLKYGATNATSGTTALAFITKVGSGEYSVDSIDVSDMDSTNKYREFIGGMIDPGSITAEVNFQKTNTTTIIGLVGTSRGWTIAIPAPSGGTTATMSFAGFIEKFAPGEMDLGGAAKGTLTIKISGAPTWA